MISEELQSPPQSTFGRICIRIFVGLMLVTIALDTAPWWKVLTPLKTGLYPVLQLTGLWQGQWPLFAPNPVINNRWISVEFHAISSTEQLAHLQQPVWNSPIWSTVNAWDKLHRFRHIDFYNHIPQASTAVLEDFADYVARSRLGAEFHPAARSDPQAAEPRGDRTADGQLVELRMFDNRLEIVMPDDGSMPSPEETTWVSVSKLLVEREYSP